MFLSEVWADFHSQFFNLCVMASILNTEWVGVYFYSPTEIQSVMKHTFENIFQKTCPWSVKKSSFCFFDRAKMASEINLNLEANWRVPLGTRVNYPGNDRIEYLNVLLYSLGACKKNRPVEKWFVLKIRFDLSNPQMTFSQVQSKALEACWLYNKILQPFERVARIHFKFWILTV